MLSALVPQSLSPRTPPQKRIQNYLYQPQNHLGKGCFSTVHPGLHLLSNEPVAIKVVKLSSINTLKMHQLLDQEIAIICSLNHRNVIRCYEVLKSSNNCYFATELCEQGSLERKLKEKRRLTESEARPIIEDIYQGLSYLQKMGVVHRDLKTANVFLKAGVAKIADFGFAVQTRNQFTDLKIGSPIYMAPEALLHSVYSPKTDVWSFGVLIFELLHGRTPFSSCCTQSDLKICVAKQITEAQLRSDLSQQVKQLILSCLTIDEHRRASIAQLQNLAYFRKQTSKHFALKGDTSIPRLPLLCTSKSLILSNVTCSPKHYQRSNHRAQTMCSPPQSTFTKQSYVQLGKLRNQQSQAESTNSSLSTIQQSILLKGKLTLKEAIGLTHFCNLGFKLLNESPSDLLPKPTIKTLIIKIAEDILAKLQGIEVTFTQKELEQRKDHNLKQLVKDYISKYGAIGVPTQKIDLNAFLKQGERALNKAHSYKTQDMQYFAYLLDLFLSFTQKLQSSIKTHQYRAFSEQSAYALETCLQYQSVFCEVTCF